MAKRALQFGEIGKTGLPIYSGVVDDEPLSKLTGDLWRKAVRDMTANDASIRSMLFLVEMIARQVEWQIKPFEEENADDEELALFIRQCMFEDMQQTWQDTVAEILSSLPWGWSWFETVYKRRGGISDDKTQNSRFSDGRIGWRKWAIRSQESLTRWEFDNWDEVVAMVQTPEPDFEERIIPFAKSLHFRTSSHKQNPEGASVLRGAYRSWFFKSNIENIEGIGIERDLAGYPVVTCPPEYFKSDASADQKAILNYLTDLVTKIRRDESEGVVMPTQRDEKGNDVFSLTLLSTGGARQFDTSAIIDRYDSRMLMSVMADFLLLGTKTTGSYALSDTKFRAFLKALKTWLDSICDTVNRYAIPRLLALNGKTSERAPYLECGTLEEITLKDLGSFIDVLVKAGVTFNVEEQAYLKGKANIPVDATSTDPGEETKANDEDEPVDSDEEPAADEEL